MSDFLSRLLHYDVTARTSQPGMTMSVPWTDKYMKEVGLNSEHIQPILDAQGNLLVVACAGSGKTTTLSLKVLHDMSTDPNLRVWVGTFLRTGADDLRRSIQGMYTHPEVKVMSLSGLTSRTLNSEFYHFYSELVGHHPEIISDYEDQQLLVGILSERRPDISPGLMPEIVSFLNACESAQDYSAEIEFPSMGSPLLASDYLPDWREARVSKGVLSHNDIMTLLLDTLDKSSAVRDRIACRYDKIYLDEFQDISTLQYELLKHYRVPVMAVGDDDQSIYAWRGSNVKVITEDFVKDYSPEVIHLPVNYRVPSGILTPVVRSLEFNSDRIDKDIKPYHTGGELYHYSSTIPDLLGSLQEQITADIRRGDQVAILVRTNAEGILPALAVASSRQAAFSFKLSSGISQNTGYFSQAKAFFDSFDINYDPHCVEKVFSQLSRSSRKEIRALSDWGRSQGISFIQAIITASVDDLEYSTPKLLPFHHALKEVPDDFESQVEAVLKVSVIRTSRDHHLVMVLGQILEFLRSSGSAGYVTARSQTRVLLDTLHNTDEIVNPDIIVSTVHDFKGKQAPCVYVWNDTEGSFPHAYGDTPEERRLHYIACTRPTKKLVLLSWDRQPSRFLLEMGVSPSALPEVDDIKPASYSL